MQRRDLIHDQPLNVGEWCIALTEEHPLHGAETAKQAEVALADGFRCRPAQQAVEIPCPITVERQRKIC